MKASLGISYELIITFFIILFLLFFLGFGYSNIGVFLSQMAFLFGLVLVLRGLASGSYDTFYVGIILLVVPFLLSYSLKPYGIYFNPVKMFDSITYGLFSFAESVYSLSPALLVLIILVLVVLLRNNK